MFLTSRFETLSKFKIVHGEKRAPKASKYRNRTNELIMKVATKTQFHRQSYQRIMKSVQKLESK